MSSISFSDSTRATKSTSLSDSSRVALASLHFKRSPVGTPSVDLAIVVAVIIFFLTFLALFSVVCSMLRSRRQRRKPRDPKQQQKNKDEGATERFEKRELSGESVLVVHEMDSQAIKELPDRKEGLPHELPEANILPQELPAALVIHEMPTGDICQCKKAKKGSHCQDRKL
ncbi:hypothetical protein F5Y19DRAFT_473018 [Xylariaceae sp. FL1651]|nr:hypothetical protein F5Y19DRAFT_473018 [Xylariaceae sp. FL1651]